jgi:flagellar biosynthesis protein FlhF
MNVRKFFGSSTRDALMQVRDLLGADALILSNRKVDGGVEIMAVADSEMDALTYENPTHHHAANPNISTSQTKPAIGAETIAAILHRRQAGSVGPTQAVRAPSFESIDTSRDRAEPSPEILEEDAIYRRPAIAQEVRPSTPEKPTPSRNAGDTKPSTATSDPVVAEMARELKRMRNLLEGQLSGFAWGELARNEPLKAELLRAMFAAGFSPLLSRKLVDAAPSGLDFDKSMKWLKAAVTHNLRAVEPGADVIERGGIIALVGPTGVGKTTTVAKLAARAVLKFGAQNVALLTTDSYRIGAHEQLKIYGRILNVPVHAVKDEAELELTLADLQRSHLVLIDTVGMSQRDRRIAEQIEFLCGRGNRVRRQLLLPATAQSVTLDDILRAYRGAGMDGCILTKVDESVALAPAIDCLVRYGLDLHYVTNGQRVPEDLHLANAAYLVDRAFKGEIGAAEVPSQQEMGLQDVWSGSGAILG